MKQWTYTERTIIFKWCWQKIVGQIYTEVKANVNDLTMIIIISSLTTLQSVSTTAYQNTLEYSSVVVHAVESGC